MPYKRGDKWMGQVRKDGKRREKVFLTKKEALRWEAEMRRKPVEVWNKKTVTVCLGDWAQAYMNFAKARFVHKTYDEKRSMFRRFFQQIAPDLPVVELTPAKVLAYIIKQEEIRSGYAANKDRKNLVAAWNWGMNYMEPRLQRPNPCVVERMTADKEPRYIPPEEDFWCVYDAAEGQDKVMLLTFLSLAARRNEVFRLKWSDVDFRNLKVRLWTRKRRGGGLEYDWLPISHELRAALFWWLENRPFKDKPHVFLCLDDTPFCREYYGEPFKYRLQFMRRLCDRGGVKRFGFHAIRHLAASILYHQGVENAVIQAVLRHKNPSTTDRYLKSLGLEKTRDALEDIAYKSGTALDFTTRRLERLEQNKKPSGEPSSPQTAKARLRVVR